MSSRHIRVVGCAPVPKAMPGSITTSIFSSSTAASHGGRTRRRSPTTIGRWNSFQRSYQSSGISSVSTSTNASPAAARSAGSAGSSPGAP